MASSEPLDPAVPKDTPKPVWAAIERDPNSTPRITKKATLKEKSNLNEKPMRYFRRYSYVFLNECRGDGRERKDR